MQNIKQVVIAGYGRSAVCRARKGSFAGTHPVEWASQVLAEVVARVPKLKPGDIADVIVGCSVPVNELATNTARLMVNRAGFPDSVCGQTINRFCASGLQSVATCANAIMAGQEDIMIAGGVEDMTKTFGKTPVECRDPWFEQNYPGGYMSMGITAENVAEKYGLGRAEMDAFAAASHQKAHIAQQSGSLNRSIIPVTVGDGEGGFKTVTLDEGIRPDTTAESISRLKPCFREDGLVTAATSSQTSDGAAFAVLMSRERADELGIKPLARFVSYATAGCDPTLMGLGPIYAVPKALKRAGLTLNDIDVIELNEAFASQAIACIRELGLPQERVNPWGGAIALGHPMGATGGFLLCKALDYLREGGGRFALVTMCIGGGMGAAGVFEIL